MSAVSKVLDGLPNGGVGVAVSGGSDSVALLLLMVDWARECDRGLFAVSVDHGLRAEAAEEAAGVARVCADLGVSHDVLRWDGVHSGNTQDAARRARYSLIGDWARAKGLVAVATGHTRDDQAETFLLRLKRGSGVDGLSGMAEQITKDGMLWVRPVLDQRREALRDMLRGRGVTWVDDPSNENENFDRVKMRKALEAFDELGLSVDVLADTAGRMRVARQALETACLTAAKAVATPREIGSVRLEVGALADYPEEVQLRLLAHVLGWVSGAEYRPRLSALKLALAAVLEARAHTLSGCQIDSGKAGFVEICREVAAMGPIDAALGEFDGRWLCTPTEGTWKPLGVEGLALFPEWRGSAERRASLIASPSLWHNNELKSAPFVGKTDACKCWLRDGTESFFTSILSH